MRFATKLFLSILTVLTMALAVTEYVTVSSAFRSGIEHQEADALQQHQLVKYAVQSSVLTAKQNSLLSDAVLQQISTETQEKLKVDLKLEQIDSADVNSERLTLQTVKTNGSEQLVVAGEFTQYGYSMRLTTTQDISFLYRDSEELQQRCRIIFLVVEGASAILIWFLSWFLTRSIRRLDEVSRSLTDGDYSVRAQVTSRDEIGELADSFNAMAETIQEKIAALELAVEQREDFVANFAHEIKTPMTSIIGYADTIYQKDLSPEEVHEASGIILNEGMRLEALSFKLLDLITMGRQDYMLEEMEMRPFLEDAYQTAQAAAARNEVRLMIKADDAWGRIEYDLCKTLVLNLIDNACKSGTGTVLIRGRRDGDTYRIQVKDHGRGIPADQLKRITEAFYMVDKSRSRAQHGAGLGLALCSKIAAIHHTELKFTSEEGKGTIVEFAIPVCQEVEE